MQLNQLGMGRLKGSLVNGTLGLEPEDSAPFWGPLVLSP